MSIDDDRARDLIDAARHARLSRREFLARATALGLALGPASALVPSAHAADPQKGGHMRLAMAHGATTDTLDPATIANGLQWVAAYGIANTLTELDADGKLIGALATEWSTTPDATTWTFRLRPGVEFHNGKTMTADDVIASINYHRGDASTSVAKPLVADVTDIAKDGPNIIVITLSEGNADFPVNFNEATFGIYPAKDGRIDWKSGGTGGYRLVQEEPGVRYRFERHTNYWRSDRAHADTIDLLSITDSSARTNALLTNEVDAIERVELKTLALLSRRPDVIIEEGAGPLHYSFPMRTQTAPFDNIELRKALKFAFDRQELVEKILFGHGAVGNDHPIGPSYRHHAADIEQNAYDPDKARFHMGRSGLGDVPLDLHTADAAFSGATDAATLYQARAQDAGIRINVVREPNDGYWSDVWNSKPWCACYWGGYATEDAMFTTGYAPGAAWNDTEWNDGRFDKLMRAARTELDTTRRAELYREMQVILRDDGGAVIPLFPNEVHARNASIEHGELSWVRGFDGRRILERWWMV